MQIILSPVDIIQRCIWDKYRRFVLFDKTEDEIKNIIEENKPINLSENDAYVIGLIKIIETDNLVHRFNENILDILQIKSNIIQDDLFINKNIILKEVNNYMNKFPVYYKPAFNYKQSLDELSKYILEITKQINKLELTNVKNKDKMYVYFKSKDIRKCLNI